MNQGAVVLGLLVYRVRHTYAAFCVFLLLLIGIAHLPVHILPIVTWLLCLPFGLGLLLTAFAFVNVEADMASTASAYSPWLLRLPVKTSALAFWPIAAAATWAPLSWIIFVEFYLHPLGIHFPAAWPAAAFAAFGLSLQAILWVPVKRGNVRLVLSIALPMAIALFGLMVAPFWSQTLLLAIYLGVAAICAGCAWYGVIQARTAPAGGYQLSDSVGFGNDTAVILNTKKPFASPRAAQFWLEWRRQGRVLPIATGIAMIALSLPLVWHADMDYFWGDRTVATNIWVSTAIPFLPWIPLLFATVIGMGLRKSDLRGTQGVYHVYYATRPVKSIELYYAKIKALTVGVLLAVAITGLTMLAWLCIPGLAKDGTTTPYIRIFFSNLSWRDWLLLVGMGITVLAWTWRNQVVGAFVDYLSHKEWAVNYPVAVAISGGTMFSLAQTQSDFYHSKAAYLPVLVAVTIALLTKVGLALVLSRKLIALRPETKADLIRAFARWALVSAVAATVFGLIVAWAADDAFYPCYKNPINEIVAILLVPLARPIAARIALETGRHR